MEDILKPSKTLQSLVHFFSSPNLEENVVGERLWRVLEGFKMFSTFFSTIYKIKILVQTFSSKNSLKQTLTVLNLKL